MGKLSYHWALCRNAPQCGSHPPSPSQLPALCATEPPTLSQVTNLEGASVSRAQGREFEVKGPHIDGPWLLRASTPVDAIEWCEAFRLGSRFGRAVRQRREGRQTDSNDKEAEEKRMAEYQALIDKVWQCAGGPSTPHAAPTPVLHTHSGHQPEVFFALFCGAPK